MSDTPKNLDRPQSKIEEKERYNPFEKEVYWQDFWEKEGVYRFNPELPKPIYTVDTPPPTVSGALHLGHIFSYTQAEIITRFKRMSGYNVRYPFGLDNNGLPTERLVEKETGVRGSTINLGDFVKTCLEITDKYKILYENLLKSLGLSVDWKLEYSSISADVQKISQLTFKELYDKGLIYKKNAPALYCTECQTSFAQAEKEDKEKNAVFYDISFKIEDGGELIIATTRPELLPACDAIFVNPEDERFKQIIGKKVITPLGYMVKVMTDEKVDQEKGSGAVMCCTYGDETDIYWAKKYNLKERIILDRKGMITGVNEISELNGKTVNEARRIIVENLRSGNFIKKEEQIKHNVDVHERCGTPVEFLPTTQWFIKILDMKEKLLDAGKKINWYPSHMRKRYEEWVTGLKWDWCISRERFYGIPIPAFNCSNCSNVLIPEQDLLPMDPKMATEIQDCPVCGAGKMIPERNVLDTWFTSSLSPDINNSNRLNGSFDGKLYPMSMRPQAHDIIRTWAVYSILMGLYRHNDIPWNDLMISGHILVQKGEKISKKTGGGKYKPEELIATQSADAIRYAMSGASLGKDSYFDEKEVEKGKKLVTKIYNAGKLILDKLEDFSPKMTVEKRDLEAIDAWILNKSFKTAENMSSAFSNYEFGQARQIFEDFFWKDFCDNYLEIAKARLNIRDKNSKEKRSALFASYNCLLNILKMASPFIPHITEEMFHAEIKKSNQADGSIKVFFISDSGKGYFFNELKIKSIHESQWPSSDILYSDNENDHNSDLALSVISEIRKYKNEHKIKLGAQTTLLKIKCSEDQKNRLNKFLKDVTSLARANSSEIEIVNSEELSVKIEP
ncbi:MAG: valine--tRNA ligase [Candidatus Paceibacterota bacterium]|jgi:valyl-tRNA synthetase